jgi:hypothetical protein
MSYDRQDQIVDRGMALVILLLVVAGIYINWPEIQRWSNEQITEFQADYDFGSAPVAKHVKHHHARVYAPVQKPMEENIVVGP